MHTHSLERCDGRKFRKPISGVPISGGEKRVLKIMARTTRRGNWRGEQLLSRDFLSALLKLSCKTLKKVVGKMLPGREPNLVVDG